MGNQRQKVKLRRSSMFLFRNPKTPPQAPNGYGYVVVAPRHASTKKLAFMSAPVLDESSEIMTICIWLAAKSSVLIN